MTDARAARVKGTRRPTGTGTGNRVVVRVRLDSGLPGGKAGLLLDGLLGLAGGSAATRQVTTPRVEELEADETEDGHGQVSEDVHGCKVAAAEARAKGQIPRGIRVVPDVQSDMETFGLTDPRVAKLADVLVRYSLDVKPGQLVAITMPAAAATLCEQCVRAVLQAGGHPSVRLVPENYGEVVLKYASDEQLAFTSPLLLHEAQTVDHRIAVWSESNTKALSGFDPMRTAVAGRGRRPIMDAVLGRAVKGELNWVGTLFPTPSHAQDAEMSTGDYAEFVFKAGLLDQDDPAASWKRLGEAQQRLVDKLHDLIARSKTEYRVTAAGGTDLTMDLTGKTWINCNGRHNFPDGEVFTGPDPDSVNGKVRFSFPAVHMGRECDGVELTFRDGKVIDATADKGQEFLISMLDQDEGARRLGECAIGTNYGITRFTRNTLFDEKIGGTVHFAVGKGYPETGNTNESALHWDMVVDLRPGGEVTLGGETVARDGRILGEGMPGPT